MESSEELYIASVDNLGFITVLRNGKKRVVYRLLLFFLTRDEDVPLTEVL